MLLAAKTGPGDRLVDLGAGDGRVILAASDGFGAHALGIELHPKRFSFIRNVLMPTSPNVEVVRRDFFKTDVSDADIVTMYLLPSVNNALRKKLERELHSGARVVTHDFEIPEWRPVHVEVVQGSTGPHMLFLYHI